MRTACCTSASLAPGRPKRMFSSSVSLKSTVSCGTMPIAARSDCCVTSRMSWPSIRIAPSLASWKRNSSFTSVDLPAPARAHHRELGAWARCGIHAAQDLALGLVAEGHVAELHARTAHRQWARAGAVGDARAHGQQAEHLLDRRQRALDLAIDHAEEIERHEQLHHEGVDQHEVAHAHLGAAHVARRQCHARGHRQRHDQRLPGIQREQRQAVLAPRLFPPASSAS
jgi:hypothetical protein